MSGAQQQNLSRVYQHIAPIIMAFHAADPNRVFHVEQLRRYVRRQVPDIAPDSPGRILRELRLQGALDYLVISRSASLYWFRSATTMSSTTVANPPHTRPGFTWSYTHLKNFEACPRRYNEINVAKTVKEAESPQLAWGNAVHKAFEGRVAKGTPLPLGMGMHEKYLAKLASAPGAVHAEQKLGLTASFEPSAFFGKNVWYRGVIDYTNIRDRGLAIVIDYKTGRPASDTTQLQLCAATIFAHDKNIERIRAALAFVEHEELEREEFVRDDLPEIWGGILPRVAKLVEAQATQTYPPKPGPFCKKWCPVVSCPYHGK